MEVREGSGGPPRGPGVIRRPTRRTGRGQVAQPKVQDGSGGPPGGQVGVQMPPQRSGWGWEAHPKIREGDLPGGIGVVKRPTWRPGGVGRPS